ncbi:hypothetical protein [Halalkalibacter alkalisediminis]|uniref:Uncharacterized protein n=1 Tax=Halalkalibacter alkalisediminis TaxID=935616 RepID=A0ABV6NH43_9BACI|nr:hypothetical protein [Halalkalibacter alkalisediminis]
MRIVEMNPRDNCTVTALENDVQSYFHDEVRRLSYSLAGRNYGFVCYEKGIQIKNNEVKALYGPAIICDEQFEGLSESEAKLIQRYVNDYQFDLNNLKIH